METTPIQQTRSQIVVNSFIRSVYNWMAMGLALTGFVAFYVAGSDALKSLIFGNKMIFYGLIIGELGLVFYLSAKVQDMQASTATALFMVYALLNGATLSAVFLLYTAASIASTFFVCALTFGVCSVYGMLTKRD